VTPSPGGCARGPVFGARGRPSRRGPCDELNNRECVAPRFDLRQKKEPPEGERSFSPSSDQLGGDDEGVWEYGSNGWQGLERC
jgi:hypothetical protein